jgi:hypothetical protein
MTEETKFKWGTVICHKKGKRYICILKKQIGENSIKLGTFDIIEFGDAITRAHNSRIVAEYYDKKNKTCISEGGTRYGTYKKGLTCNSHMR